MRAIGVNEFGGPDALEMLELPDPTPGHGQVVVRTAFAAVNPTDTALRAGAYGDALTEKAGDPPYVPGMDLSGTVAAIGAGVERLAVGDRVMATVDPQRPQGGAYAELVVVPEVSAVAVPDELGLDAAATLPMNGLTAMLALDQLGLQPNDVLAVTGAAGILGGFAVALGVYRDLRVVADAKPEDLDLVRSFGAHHVVARGDDVADRIRAQVPDGVDGLLDAAVQNEQALPAVRDGGGFATVRSWDGDNDRDVTVHKVWVWEYLERTDKLTELLALAEAGILSLRVADSVPFEEAADTHRRLAEGGLRGRLLLAF